MQKVEERVKFEAYSTSLCPEGMKKIPMRIYEENGVIYLEKTCPEHGKFEDIYWGDAEIFRWFYDNWYNAQYVSTGLEKPHTKTEKGCPFDCGICPQHKTPTILRDDLPRLIKEAQKLGISHVEVNTNGIRIAEDVEYFKKLLDSGLSTLY